MCIRDRVCTFVSKRVKTCQKHIFWHYFLTPAPVCERYAISCLKVSKKTRVKKCFATPACQNVSRNRKGQKHKGLRVRKCQNVSKRVKKCEKACQHQFRDPPEALKSCPKPCKPQRNISQMVQACLKVSKNVRNVRKPKVFGECQNVSNRVKKGRVSIFFDTVSKRIKKRVKTCHNVSKRV